MERLNYLFNILVAALLLLTVAINRDGKIFGENVDEIFSQTQQTETIPLSTINSDGEGVINTAALEEKIFGYGGKTPLKIFVKANKITSIELGKNSETPEFLDAAINSGLLERWNGLTLQQAATESVDGVSGATLSSQSIIRNVQSATAKVADLSTSSSSWLKLSAKEIIALIVIALGIFMSARRITQKRYKVAMFILNVAVLGFWCGSFLSISLLTAWFSNGINLASALIPATLFAVALVMPLFNRKGSYCAHYCPMGAAQELVSLCNKKKIRIDPKIAKVLNNLRYAILAIMFALMWIGVGFSLMDYEVFSAFMFETASTPVLILAVVFLLLSIVIHRPYCRFICPTGALLTLTQKTKTDNKI